MGNASRAACGQAVSSCRGFDLAGVSGGHWPWRGTSNLASSTQTVDWGKILSIKAASCLGAIDSVLCAFVMSPSSFLIYLYWRYSSPPSEAPDAQVKRRPYEDA